ncbi:hypothetical protein KR044_009198, partial [Drosophila immigrans]
SCQESKQLESSCGNYCFQAIKPMLDHTKYLQSQVNDFNYQTENLAKPENLQKFLDVWIEEKLKTFWTATEKTLLKQLKSQDEKVDKKLQDVKKLLEAQISIPGQVLLYQKIGSKYYYIEESEEISWFGAVNKCLQFDGHLVSIENQDELNAIRKKLQPNKDYWIDINDLDKEGEFTSIATGRKATYLIWKSGEPSNSDYNEHCLELYCDEYHRMNDDTCNKKQLFICELNNQP